jgi:hypothetical protein
MPQKGTKGTNAFEIEQSQEARTEQVRKPEQNKSGSQNRTSQEARIEQVRKRGLPPLVEESKQQRGKPLFLACSILEPSISQESYSA